MFVSHSNPLNSLVFREEGTFPYIPELPVTTEGIMNYNMTLFHIRGIHTSPTGLESTSIVLAYGLGKSSSSSPVGATLDVNLS